VDAALRNALRDYRRGAVSRETAVAALARAGVTADWFVERAEVGLRWALLDQLDYRTFALDPPTVVVQGADEAPARALAVFCARSRRDVVLVTVWWPTTNELPESGDLDDLRFEVNADFRLRSEVIATIAEAFPRGTVVSSQVARGKRPPRDLVPALPSEEAAWPEESKRVHVR
jgi:hypothetical protein